LGREAPQGRGIPDPRDRTALFLRQDHEGLVVVEAEALARERQGFGSLADDRGRRLSPKERSREEKKGKEKEAAKRGNHGDEELV